MEEKSQEGMEETVSRTLSRPVMPRSQQFLTGKLVFQNVSIDQYIGFAPGSNTNRQQRSARSIIRVYGVTAEGYSVLAHIIGFAPYFYVEAWRGFSNDLGECEMFRKALDVS